MATREERIQLMLDIMQIASEDFKKIA